MGRSHALTGAAAYLAFGPRGGLISTAVGATVCAGAALLPDIDHPQATMGTILGPISETVARGVALSSGGHRGASHSAVGVGIAYGGAYAIARWAPWQAGAIAVALLVACAVKALGVPIVGGRIGALVVGVGVAVVWPTLSPQVVLIGVLAHLAGDALTDKGIRPLYPLTKDHFTFGVAGTTGGVREQIIAAGLGVSIILMALGLQGRIPGL
jgi:membrane-bound metal-dependent hydrolase YbcI (DUF457 family)